MGRLDLLEGLPIRTLAGDYALIGTGPLSDGKSAGFLELPSYKGTPAEATVGFPAPKFP